MVADDVDIEVWSIIIEYSSMASRSLLMRVSRTVRDAVVRVMSRAMCGNEELILKPDQAWARISTVLLHIPLFLTGGAGVGKTATTNVILDDLRGYYETQHGRIEYMRAVHEYRVAVQAAAEAHEIAPNAPKPAVPPEPPAPPKLNMLVVAPTGTAAQLIDGRTAHSAFNVRLAPKGPHRILHAEENEPPSLDDSDDDDGAGRKHVDDAFAERHDHDDEAMPSAYQGDQWAVVLLNKSLKKQLKGLDALVIDEVSMLDGDLLNLFDEACREARGQPDTPFGGIYVLLVGDFCQLPPVINKEAGVDGGEHGFAFQSRAWLALRPRVVDLVVPVRQDENGHFIQVLKRARRGRITQADIRWLSDNGHSAPAGTELGLMIATNNAIRDARNNKKVRDAPGEYQARDAAAHPDKCDFFRARIGGTDALTNKVYSRHDPRAWLTVPQPSFRVCHHKKAVDRFDFKVGARVRCTKNISESGPAGKRVLVVPNGAVGTITASEMTLGTDNLVARVKVHWDKASRTRDAFTRMQEPVWYDRMQTKRYEHTFNNETRWLLLKAVRRQLPLEICYAKNVNSAQGSTVFVPTDVSLNKNRAPPDRDENKNIIRNGPRGIDTFKRRHGLIYTALSRFPRADLMRHLPTPSRKDGPIPDEIFKADDVYCDPVVDTWYTNNTGTTPGWMASAL